MTGVLAIYKINYKEMSEDILQYKGGNLFKNHSQYCCSYHVQKM